MGILLVVAAAAAVYEFSQVQDIQKQLNAAGGGGTGNSASQIKALQDEVTALQSQVSQLQTTNSQLQSQVSQLQTTSSQQAQQINDLNSIVSLQKSTTLDTSKSVAVAGAALSDTSQVLSYTTNYAGFITVQFTATRNVHISVNTGSLGYYARYPVSSDSNGGTFTIPVLPGTTSIQITNPASILSTGVTVVVTVTYTY